MTEQLIVAARARLEQARDQQNREYWAFTRQARGVPVSRETSRAVVEAEDRLRELLRGTHVE